MNILDESGLRTLAEELAESWINGNRNNVVSDIFHHPQRAGLAAATVLTLARMSIGDDAAELTKRLARLECA